MKYKLLLLNSIIFLLSCQNSSQERKEIIKEKPIVVEPQKIAKKLEHYHKIEKIEEEYNSNNDEQFIKDCDDYLKNIFTSSSTKAKYIDELISKTKLSENNIKFLTALKNENKDDLGFKKVLAPIFRLSTKEIGIFTFPKYKDIEGVFYAESKEIDLIMKYDTVTKSDFGKIVFMPKVLNGLFKKKTKPFINYYTTTKIDSTRLLELGYFEDPCLEYFEYSIDTTSISLKDELLFSSPYIIDLVYENNTKIDSLIHQGYRKECQSCPNSTKFEKTFARIKGTDNLYFVYADTFPINDKLDTPSRALVLLTNKNKLIYLWYDEIDLFRCSCD